MNQQIQLNVNLVLPSQALAASMVAGVVFGGLLIFLGYGLVHIKGGTCSPAPCDVEFNKRCFAGILDVMAFILIVRPYFRFKNCSYKITESSILINSGILTKDTVTIDFKKIQSIDIQRGLIEQFFGVSSLKIWTASPGPGNGNARLPTGLLTLLENDAVDLQAFINARQ